MKKIKSVEDVQNVPEDEYIWMIDLENETCPFCGVRLRYRLVYYNHGQCRQYHKCDCEISKAADVHNKRVQEIQHKAWLECRKQEEKKRQKELGKEQAY